MQAAGLTGVYDGLHIRTLVGSNKSEIHFEFSGGFRINHPFHRLGKSGLWICTSGNDPTTESFPMRGWTYPSQLL
jgi:hypothetical protein